MNIRTIQPCVEGFFLLHKPPGMTSAYAVGKIKKYLRCKRGVGHSGTLDPLAEGLLVIGIGTKATRMMPQIITLNKSYDATMTFGYETDTLDLEGSVVYTSNIVIPSYIFQEAVHTYTSTYNQTPPVFSALRYQGNRLHKLARFGVPKDDVDTIVAQKVRSVTIYKSEIKLYAYPSAQVHFAVSHGTYIRSLMRDIAHACSSYATLTQLVRTSIGPFLLQNAHTLYAIEAALDPKQYISSNMLPVSLIAEYLKNYVVPDIQIQI